MHWSNRNSNLVRLVVTAIAIVALGGCAATGEVKNMRTIATTGAYQPKPDSGKATIVFMRPSVLGFAVQSSVFLIDNDPPQLVGVVASKKALAYQVDPGEHLFMAVGESGDFMSANVLAGKIYYALVTPRMGVWKARFSLRPLSQADLAGPEFKEWMDAIDGWVEKGPESEQWAKENMPSVVEKRNQYLPEWRAKNVAEQPRLQPDSGR